MRPSHFLTGIFISSVFVVGIVLIAAYALPTKSIPSTNLKSHSEEEAVEREVVIQSRSINEQPNQPAAVQSTPFPDGPSIIENHCERCHIPQLIIQVKKSRSEWEQTLDQMEKMGVSMSEDEKTTLLDFLISGDNP